MAAALQHLLDFPRKKSGAAAYSDLTPARELAVRVADHARELAKHTHTDAAAITGGVAMNAMLKCLRKPGYRGHTTGRLLQYAEEL
ncbi:hypothetical protein KCP77_08560 [Salmonella enterica subsp. enterica]|nr:hypothetical protein KCP77_08560 [Salmonella enterica subsp. enterica]